MLNIKSFFLKGTICFFALIFPSALEVFAKEYTIVLIPDTQNYTLNKKNIYHFKEQIKWIINNKENKNIVFVSHVGDVIASNLGYFPNNLHLIGFLCNKRNVDFLKNQSETWEKVRFISDLGNIEDLAFSISPGNHDYDCKNNKKTLKGFQNTINYKKYHKRKWFLGADETGINTAQIFEINKQEFIHIGLEWQPSNKAIKFAQKIINEHPKKPVILTTHEYLIVRDNPLPERCKNSAIGCSWTSSNDNNGEELFQKLIKNNPQIFMVFSGHNGSKERLIISKNSLDRKVIQIVSDFSGDPEGGNGWMTLITFNTDNSSIMINNFSPTYKEEISLGPNRSKQPGQKIIELNLTELKSFLSKNEVKNFRNGEIHGIKNYTDAKNSNIYQSILGKKIKSKIPIFKETILVGKFFGEHIGSLHFKNIIGTKHYQIPPNSKIEKAILTLTSNQISFSKNYEIGANGILKFYNKLKIYPIDKPLSKSKNISSINKLKEKIVQDSINRFISSGISNTTQSFDVTSEFQKWADGAENSGWLFYVPQGFWNFKSSESTELLDRPMLTIVYKK